jgi:probable rRNA maturation factor
MEINILIEEGIEVDPDAEWMQKVIEKVLIAESVPAAIEISLLITGQERIQELNRDYRGKDRPTDVLSFSMSEQKQEDEPTAFIGPPDGLLHLGEIVISYPQALVQAREHEHSIMREMAILIVHGVLHILGYDHEKRGMEAAMREKETKILAELEKEIG